MSEAAQVLSPAVPAGGANPPAVAKPTETPVAPAAATPPADERLSPKFSVLAKKEAAAVKKLQEAQALMAQVQRQQEELKTAQKELEDFRALRSNPLKALEHLGTDYTKLTQMYLNQGQPTPEMHIDGLRSEIDTIKKLVTERETKVDAERQRQAESEAKEIEESFKQEIGQAVDSGKEQYPLTHMYNRSDLVYATIDYHYHETAKSGQPEIMDISKALELTEAYLVKEAQKAQELLSKKASPQVTPQVPSAPKSKYDWGESRQWVEKPVRTLSDERMQPSVSPAPTHFLSDEERLMNAVAKMKSRRQR